MQRFRIPVLSLAIIFSTLCATANKAHGGAIEDAKRKVATELVKGGKFPEAISVLNEITASDPSQYRDFVVLADCYEKTGDSAGALAAYRKIIALVPEHTHDLAAARARTDAVRRSKSADGESSELDAAIKDFEHHLDNVEKQAMQSQNSALLKNVFRLRASMWRAENRAGKAGFEVFAGASWQDSQIPAVAGKKYLTRAIGTWSMDGVTCGPAGVKGDVPNGTTPYGPLGCLLVSGPKGSAFIRVPPNGEFTAVETGNLRFFGNHRDRTSADGAGSVFVLILEATPLQ